MTEWTIGATDAGTRLDKFLAAADRLGSRGKAAAALERGKIYVNGEEALMRDASRALAEGDHVRFWVDRPGSAKSRPRIGVVGDLDVVYEDDRLIVVNKPAGLLSVPLERNPGIPSVYDQIEERFRPFGKMRPLVVHRIDQDTSGLVVFAKDEEAQARTEGTVQAPRAGPALPGRRLRDSRSARRHVAGLSGLGREAADPEDHASQGSARLGGDQLLPDGRAAARCDAD